ncbi:sugar transferase [Amycolatopsis alkalitolerans]|uniref:Sugar transferase n=1 Tax=Amycolatopsis alkalitolerans TaxID=2547244 RepID=A0A5C4LSC4_9PSEU|nr:sugar transferase [Amycolatopsis alkalitolerans]TNC21871.1 sugar transferase [Amycolatopsis alkalitolerans]
MIAAGRPVRDGSSRRAFDLLAAGAALVLLSPVLLIMSLLIHWRLGAPVLFRQPRSGRHGRQFMILKFRSMHPLRYRGQPDHERTTRLGAALRRTSLDELPQLVNVLRGEMSLIGPRPTLPEQVDRYDRRQFGRLSVRPGLTGLAQVRGRNLLSWPERIELDLWYLAHRSWRLDARILLLTLARLARPRGITGHAGTNPGFPGTPPEHS